VEISKFKYFSFCIMVIFLQIFHPTSNLYIHHLTRGIE
jgi:hypothetical protein